MKGTSVLVLTILAVLAAVLTGCLAARMPIHIAHSKPNLNINQAIYEKLGCEGDGACHTEGTELASLGCEFLLPANPLLGGLSPSYPIAQFGWRLATGRAGLYPDPCAGGYGYGLAVLRDGQYQLVASDGDLQALYAPIESEDEALSFAILATGLDPAWYEGLDPKGRNGYPGLKFLTVQLEDTHVTKSENAYSVRLEDTVGCGCSTHPTSAVDVVVTVDGQTQISSQVPIFELDRQMCWE